jgi:3-deoxy-manno-octulosonate cytidylyltransferase (CMP-KDO synthetase)
VTSLAILIPARYESTRFPGKPLARLGGIHMIRRVYEQCRKAGKILNADVFVLTDDTRIADVLESNHVWLDKREYANGTERCAGFAKSKLGNVRYDRKGTVAPATLSYNNCVDQYA